MTYLFRELKEEVQHLKEHASEDVEKPREETAKVTVVEQKRNPVLVYIERLAAADDSAWKDQLEPMGISPDIPKLFRTNAKAGTLELSPL